VDSQLGEPILIFLVQPLSIKLIYADPVELSILFSVRDLHFTGHPVLIFEDGLHIALSIVEQMRHVFNRFVLEKPFINELVPKESLINVLASDVVIALLVFQNLVYLVYFNQC